MINIFVIFSCVLSATVVSAVFLNLRLLCYGDQFIKIGLQNLNFFIYYISNNGRCFLPFFQLHMCMTNAIITILKLSFYMISFTLKLKQTYCFPVSYISPKSCQFKLILLHVLSEERQVTPQISSCSPIVFSLRVSLARWTFSVKQRIKEALDSLGTETSVRMKPVQSHVP